MKANFFSELKRRNVYKVAIAYGVVAWLLMQVASQIFPFFELPNWAVRLVVLLLIIGFPVALILAWAFELTPEGIKRAESADELPTKASRNRAWIYVVAVAGAISLSLFFLGRYTASFRSGTRQTESFEKSIAVLPFENLSEDKANEYFAEGIQEEILTRLSKIADLKVISRTSTQKYKSAPGGLREIAQQLGVANILEGGVQKAADQVRVNVQLINANTDAHLWAETYDRNATDIFGVESEIAKTIADKLEAKLTGSEQRAIAVRPTENTQAHQLYLKGRYFLNRRTADDLKKSIDHFNQAIAADPNYALAYVGLADSYSLLPSLMPVAPHEYFPKAKVAVRKALDLDDSLAEAHTSLAVLLCSYDFNFPQADREFQRAIELNPNYATAHHWYGAILLGALARFDQATGEVKRALELDPLSLVINADLGRIYYFARRYDQAIYQLRKTLEMDPNFFFAHRHLVTALEVKGDVQGAIAECQKARALNNDPRVLALLGHAYAVSGKKSEALDILEQMKVLTKDRYVSPYSFALVHLGLGDKEEALRWLEQSYQDRFPEVIRIKTEPLLDSLRGDPRFEALADKIVPANVK
jgi:TolB-like protein/Tfp pilus assembly protein PilF